MIKNLGEYAHPKKSDKDRAKDVAFRTKGGSVSAEGRRKAEKEGDTMPGGKFPIRNKSDLSNAKHDVGRASDPAAARRWINKRAKELGEPALGESKRKKSPLHSHPRSP